METTAGIMPSLQSICSGRCVATRCKACLRATSAVDGRWHRVPVLQVQVWQLLFPDQRLFGTDAGHRTATVGIKKKGMTHERHPATYSQSGQLYCQNRDSTAYENTQTP